jgi:glycosyltransferase involved in cell wall biosynthesis
MMQGSTGKMFKDRICFVVSSPMTARVFLTGHLLALSRRYSVDLVCHANGGAPLDSLAGEIQVIPVAIERKVSLLADLDALWRLYRHFCTSRYGAICSVTPKAGLLSLLAAFFSRTPVRIHIFTGQVWVTRSGVKRWLLKAIDKLMAWLATDLLTDSPSQREFLIAEGVVCPEKIQVLAGGSICGVDLERFQARPGVRANVRQELGIPENAVVVLFLGRMNRDKGVLDLAQAYADLAVSNQSLWLLLVGPDEENIQADVAAICAALTPRTRLLGFADQPERFMAAADIFALPSYREGFGSSVIEAAACGLPSVCSRIYGLTDAVVDGVTGVLHSPADVEGIKRGLEKLLDPSLRERLGEAAKDRAVNEFNQQRLTDGMLSFIASCLAR